MEQELLPKPETDLPTPRPLTPERSDGEQAEKEIPAHVGEKAGRKFQFPKFFLLGILFVVILALIGGIYYLDKNSSNKQVVETKINYPLPRHNNLTRDSLPSVTHTPNTSFTYLKDNDVYLDGSKITDTNGTIYKYEYSEDNQMIIYITGKKANSGNHVYIDQPREVFIQKIGQDPQKIFELTPVYEPNSDYALKINDIGFSEDGKDLALTTTQNLYIYDMTGTPKNSIDLPKKDQGLVYFYGRPAFSANNSKVLLRKGYYEGSGNSVVELSTKKVTDLGYSAYVAGSYAIGWLPNDKMLVYDYSDASSNESPESPKTSLIIVSSDNVKEKTYPLNKILGASVSVGGKLYAVTTDGYDSKTSELIEFDTSDGSRKIIAKLPTIGNSTHSAAIAYSKKLNIIFVDTRNTLNGTQLNRVYQVDLSSPNPQFTLFQDNSELFGQDY